jgi:hypothetical protein
MNPLTVSAQFAAYVWFGEHQDNTGKTCAEAMRFARENWEVFLPLAQPGLGRLLLKIAKPRPTARKFNRQYPSELDVKALALTTFSCN